SKSMPVLVLSNLLLNWNSELVAFHQNVCPSLGMNVDETARPRMPATVGLGYEPVRSPPAAPMAGEPGMSVESTLPVAGLVMTIRLVRPAYEVSAFWISQTASSRSSYTRSSSVAHPRGFTSEGKPKPG